MSLQRSDLSRSKGLMKYFEQTSVWSLLKKMVFPVSDIVVFPLSSNESVFGTITSSEEKGGHVSNSLNSCQEIYEEGRGPRVDGGRKWLKHRKQSLFVQETFNRKTVSQR